ncbi:hypothetical protein C7N83_02335 [Neisseria iguanae]|uniref:Uncharacterized protein n=2 Tax=Neisseria iguanae TaxID=90242 RepID=A0A2P7U285_9NEIS|nr:hypothetical protein C7N83_02335 [Neisseria iguanae]
MTLTLSGAVKQTCRTAWGRSLMQTPAGGLTTAAVVFGKLRGGLFAACISLPKVSVIQPFAAVKMPMTAFALTAAILTTAFSQLF